MKRKNPLGHLTPSICEAAFEEYAKYDDTLSELIHKARLEVRHFIILSFICDQESLSAEQVCQILGLPMTKTQHLIDHLVDAKMVELDSTDGHSDASQPMHLTTFGKLVVMRVHDQQGAL
jgi:hypothetical protein